MDSSKLKLLEGQQVVPERFLGQFTLRGILGSQGGHYPMLCHQRQTTCFKDQKEQVDLKPRDKSLCLAADW